MEEVLGGVESKYDRKRQQSIRDFPQGPPKDAFTAPEKKLHGNKKKKRFALDSDDQKVDLQMEA